MEKIKHAARLLTLGFRIFPVVPNTRFPAFVGWQERAGAKDILDCWSASGDPIGRTRKGMPVSPNPDFNIGVATGKGLLVLDVDVKAGKGGLDSLLLLEEAGLPLSYRVRTPSGGLHVYLSVDRSAGVPNSVDNLPDFPGIDIRGDGGLVLGAGSTIDGRAYVETD